MPIEENNGTLCQKWPEDDFSGAALPSVQ